MKNLLVWQKLALLGAVFLVPLVVVTYELIASVNNLGIASARHELLGIAYARALQPVLHDLQLLRGAGVMTPEAELAARRADLQRDVAHLDMVDSQLRAGLSLSSEWPTLAAQCRKAVTGDPATSAPEEMTRILASGLQLLIEVSDHSELTLDPELVTYYYMDVGMWKLPQHAEFVAQAWSLLAHGQGTPGEPLDPGVRKALRRLAGVIDFLHAQANESLAKARAAGRQTGQDLRLSEPVADAIFQALASEDSPAEPPALGASMSARLAGDYALAEKVGVVLENLLQARIARLDGQVDRSLAIGAAGLLLVSALGWLLIRDITQPLGELAATAHAIEGGQLDAKVAIGHRRDEIGRLALALCQMVTALRTGREKLVESNLAMLEANEKLQAKTAEAETANRAKRDFLAVMSHEIRTPMNGIIGMTELALNTELTATQREYLDMVRSSAETLLELLNDILDFSKIEAGRLELERIDFDLRDLLGDTMQTLGLRAYSRGLELALQIRPDVPDALTGDPHRLRQIMVNLVGNALKFTEQGEVSVLVENAPPVDHGGEGNDDVNLRFVVRDTGIGIPPEAQARIFNAFAQADTSTTRRFGGTGLGLAITSQLVEMMGGKIEVQSAAGQGSTFTFAANFRRQPEHAPAPALPELEHLRVLAVDDNATNRHILRELFLSWGMEVVIADSASAALAALERAGRAGQPIALVVTDMMMPDIDGFGLVERMKQDPGLRETRVIMLTSSNRAEDVARCERLGIGAHLAKPIKQSRLMDTIVNVLGKTARPRQPGPADDIPRQRSLRILLAEDNAVNQRLAVVNLEAWGHQVTVARDGREAVEACTAHPFDLILMDSQMPRMGGFEATAEIRRREAEVHSRSGIPAALPNNNGAEAPTKVALAHRIPIIAMTANVMKGYREECLTAGMDGYVAKPMRRLELIKEIASVVPDFLVADDAGDRQGADPASPPAPSTTAAPEEPAPASLSPTADAPFDAEALLESLGGNRATLAEMIRLCLDEDAPRLLGNLREGLVTHDCAAVEQAAHGLKGLVGEFHAPATYAAAKQLEDAGRGHETESIPGAAQVLLAEFDRLSAALRRFLAE